MRLNTLLSKIEPNYLTVSRAALFGPIALVCMIHGTKIGSIACLVAMILAETSDFFDGKLARATNQVTDVGKLLDPMCDSIYRITIWCGLIATGWIAGLYILFVWVFFVRDSLVLNLRMDLRKSGFVMSARFSGKIKAGAQAVTQGAIVFLHTFWQGQLTFMLLSIAASITLYSAIDYFCAYLMIKKNLKATTDSQLPQEVAA